MRTGEQGAQCEVGEGELLDSGSRFLPLVDF